jgi:hypothetical protein
MCDRSVVSVRAKGERRVDVKHRLRKETARSVGVSQYVGDPRRPAAADTEDEAEPARVSPIESDVRVASTETAMQASPGQRAPDNRRHR